MDFERTAYTYGELTGSVRLLYDTMRRRPRLLNVDDRAYASQDKREAPDSSLWSNASFDLSSPPDEQQLTGEPHSDERQITLDTDRSFVLYPVGEQLFFPLARSPLIWISGGLCTRGYKQP